MNNRKTPNCLPSITILLLLGACAKPPMQGGFGALPVKIQPVQSATIQDTSDYVARLNSRESVTLQPRVSGQISKILVQQGDLVEAGTPLLIIDSSQQKAVVQSNQAAMATAEAEVESQRAAIASAQASLESARATLSSKEASRLARRSSLELQRRDTKRDRDLYAQGVINQRTLDSRINNLETAESDLNALDRDIAAQRATVAKAEADVNKARSDLNAASKRTNENQANVTSQQVQLQYFTISAPFTGIVGNIPVKEGDFVNNASQLLTLTQNKSLEVEVQVPAERSPQLRLGMTVDLLDAQNKSQGESKVFFIAPNANTQTQSVLIKSLFDNKDNILKAEQFVRARVVWGESDGVLIPINAISRLAGQNYLFVATTYDPKKCNDNEEKDKQKIAEKTGKTVAVQVPVKLGKIIANNQEVQEGLKAGEKVVVSDILKLQNCIPIQVIEDSKKVQAQK